MNFLIRRLIYIMLVAVNLTACLATQPKDITNVCAIFEDRRSWYRAAKNAEQRWGVPIAANMAIIYQESSFRAKARPERSKVLWIFPGARPSSAYGYAQALDGTWQDYIRVSSNRNASRSEFDDAIDFVAWYNSRSTRINNIARDDARALYFAYHEGNGGYRQKSYLEKPWLVEAANLVQSNFNRFSSQLANCRLELDKSWFQRLIS